jgi:chaperonin GroEL (HSP60 family)
MIKEELPPGEVPPEEVQESNALISIVFSEMFKPILGPFGSKKLITKGATKEEVVDLVSNNAYGIIKELKYNHPTADMVINTGLVQGKEVGDGVATVMILLGELVKRGYELKNSGIHQNVIVRGYERSVEKVKQILRETASVVDTSTSDEFLNKVAKTALKKSDYWEEDKMGEIIVESIKRISNEKPIDVDDVSIVTESGRGVYETRLFDGVVIDREVLDDLPKEVENANVALLDFPIEHKEPKSKVRKGGRTQDFVISISKPSLMQAFRDTRAEIFNQIVEGIKNSGANVVCCQRGIDDEAVDKFRIAGIMVLKRVKNTDMRRLERATGAKVVKDVKDLNTGKMGFAGKVLEKEIGGDKYVFFEECPYKKAAAIIIRGATNRVLEGIVSEIKSALHCVALVMENRSVVPGGGALEMECALELRKFANTLPNKEQLAVNAFTDALEAIPVAIAKNSGMDPIDTIVELRAAHSEGNKSVGISAVEKSVKELLGEIIEPLEVKLHAFGCATDAAVAILKIDDLLIAKRKEDTRLEIEKKAPEFRYKGGRIKY